MQFVFWFPWLAYSGVLLVAFFGWFRVLLALCLFGVWLFDVVVCGVWYCCAVWLVGGLAIVGCFDLFCVCQFVALRLGCV